MKTLFLRSFVLGVVFLFWGILTYGQDFSKGNWVDLTYDFSEETLYWPTSKTFTKTVVFEGETQEGYYYSAYNFESAEHGGTHLDSPVHFAKGQHTVEQIPIDQLIGQAVVIDVAEKANQNRDYQVSIEDILGWEKLNGGLPESCIVLFHTGSGKFWPDRKLYMGTEKLGGKAVKELHFPGIHPDTAKFLATERKIKAVGIDTPSIDYGQSKDYLTHRILFEKNIPGFENVAHLDKLPAKGATVFALPMKIKGGSGAPLRMIAFVPNC